MISVGHLLHQVTEQSLTESVHHVPSDPILKIRSNVACHFDSVAALQDLTLPT